MPNEQTPLLEGFDTSYEHREIRWDSDPHAQFCMLVGVPPSQPVGDNNPQFKVFSRAIPRKSLYGRATRQLANQRFTYYATAALSNTLLLSQVVLGAALTALGASSSSHVLITLFGAANTIIAGLVAYLKSRGQPMRARMFLDDLERVVGEIENSEVMWLGITHSANGYDDINVDDGGVSVRSEVARLTRLYDRAVNSNSVNNPDMYMAGSSEGSNSSSRLKPQHGPVVPLPPPPPAAAPPPPVAAPPVQPVVPVVVPAPPAPPVVEEVEPATAAPTPVTPPPVTPPPKPESQPEPSPEPKQEPKKEENKDDSKDSDNVKNDDDEPTSAPESNGNHDDVTPDNTNTVDAVPVTPEVASVTVQSQPVVVPPPMDPDASPASDINVPLKSNIKVSRQKNGEA